MKNNFFNSLALLSILGMAIACTKENNTSQYKQQISLRADGVLFTVTTGGADVEEADAHINSGRFQLDATTSIKDFSINKQIVNDLGTYNVAGSVLDFAQWEDGSLLFSSIGSSRSHLQFTITEKRETSSGYYMVAGNFSGVLYNVTQTDSVIITNGSIEFID